MYCPHTVIAWRNPWVYIVRHESADYHCGTPWQECVNPLRYEIQVTAFGGRLTINRKGRAALWLSNLLFRLKGGKLA